jgi:hypothetical protein
MSRPAEKPRSGNARSARSRPGPFAVKDCALLAIATGSRAQNLREFRDQLRVVPPASIYYHFWGRLLRPSFDDPEFSNDFASWARHGVHDHPLAERLAVIDPTDFGDLEALRLELIEVVEQRLEEHAFVPWARSDHEFHFLRSQIVVFDTPHAVSNPRDLVDLLPRLPLASIFYHVIDARRRTPQRTDDIRAWLAGFGNRYEDLITRLGFLDPFFSTLAELRSAITSLMEEHLGTR